jgi:hypothetical protein
VNLTATVLVVHGKVHQPVGHRICLDTVAAMDLDRR